MTWCLLTDTWSNNLHQAEWWGIDVPVVVRTTGHDSRALRPTEPPPWARRTGHETEEMLRLSANRSWASGKRWHHRQIRADAASFAVAVSACAFLHSSRWACCVLGYLGGNFGFWWRRRLQKEMWSFEEHHYIVHTTVSFLIYCAQL